MQSDREFEKLGGHLRLILRMLDQAKLELKKEHTDLKKNAKFKSKLLIGKVE